MGTGCFAGGFAYGTASHEPKGHWAIGIFESTSPEPVHFSPCQTKPVLTVKDVTDFAGTFVADPFLVHEGDLFYMFFEVGRDPKPGVIALATSKDGLKWKYEQIVLAEPFHLSYPYVFKWADQYYMIPEASASHSVRLYKAVEFPTKWAFEKTLLKGPRFADNSIFEYHGRWWLFSETRSNDTLRLYSADTPLGPWKEHPKSPVIDGDMTCARPGGRVIVWNDRVFRYAQDDSLYYGCQLWAFEIMKLDAKSYEEKLIGDGPVLRGVNFWNLHGMHQLSPCKVGNRWIASVDGF